MVAYELVIDPGVGVQGRRHAGARWHPPRPPSPRPPLSARPNAAPAGPPRPERRPPRSRHPCDNLSGTVLLNLSSTPFHAPSHFFSQCTRRSALRGAGSKQTPTRRPRAYAPPATIIVRGAHAVCSVTSVCEAVARRIR
ncbi:unnamed protein product [Plutella xylostella]|uniref:(diamondback moth) hypothetical protein n=1 Tax=Plutella xylostella TaxID=51655 RepID=A0A8S4D1F8_PLUXY|nr:unnamed protein product [Plutella xylostella]